MNPANRCPQCGGVAYHLVTDIKGNNYYQCRTGLTSLEKEGEELSRGSHIISCDTLIDQFGRIFSGIIAYVTGDRTRTLVVSSGKIR